MMHLMPRLISLLFVSFILTGCNTIDSLLYEASGDAERYRAEGINEAKLYDVIAGNCKMFGIANVAESSPYCLLYVANIRKDAITLYASDNRFSTKDGVSGASRLNPGSGQRDTKTERDLNLSWAYDRAWVFTREQLLELNRQGAILRYFSSQGYYVGKEATERHIFLRFISHTRRPL